MTFSANETAPNAQITHRSRLVMISYAVASKFYAFIQTPRIFLRSYCLATVISCNSSYLPPMHTVADARSRLYTTDHCV